MSIVHKAYLFEYSAFEAEFASLLYTSLEQNKVELLEQFIQQHCVELTDLDTWEPLGEDWQDHSEADQDIQWYADIALTKYYDLAMGNLGLSYSWDALGAYLESLPQILTEADTLICGRLFGPPGHRLDPGKMGTGLLSPTEVLQLNRLFKTFNRLPIPEPEAAIYAECLYVPESVEEVRNALEQLQRLYTQASEEHKGLLFKDFNDRGVSRL